MRLIDFSLSRRVTVAMGAVALVLFGLVAYQRLSINLLPDLSYPSLTVETRYPGAAPAEIESLVTRPIEEVVGVVSGVQRLTSVSRPGLSQVTLEFDWKRDMDFAALDVREKLDLIRLPEQAQKPVVLRFDPANDPILRLYLTGGASLYELRYVGEEIVKKDLESTEGVAAIRVNGGYEEEVQVKVDEGKLALVGLTIEQVNAKLLEENVNQAGGSLYESEARYLVRANNEFQGLDDIMKTVLASPEGRSVRVEDVAPGGARAQAARRRHPFRSAGSRRARSVQGGRRQHRAGGEGSESAPRDDRRRTARGHRDLRRRGPVEVHRGVDPGSVEQCRARRADRHRRAAALPQRRSQHAHHRDLDPDLHRDDVLPHVPHRHHPQRHVAGRAGSGRGDARGQRHRRSRGRAQAPGSGQGASGGGSRRRVGGGAGSHRIHPHDCRGVSARRLSRGCGGPALPRHGPHSLVLPARFARDRADA